MNKIINKNENDNLQFKSNYLRKIIKNSDLISYIKANENFNDDPNKAVQIDSSFKKMECFDVDKENLGLEQVLVGLHKKTSCRDEARSIMNN